jgi:hypothetical protein
VVGGAGWAVDLVVSDEIELTALSVLALGLEVRGPFAGDLALEATSAGGDSRISRIGAAWSELTRDALIVVSLAPLKGSRLAGVRLVGTGMPPTKLLHRAVVRNGGVSGPSRADDPETRGVARIDS